MTDYGTPSTHGSDASTEIPVPSATERARDIAGSAAEDAGGVAGTAVDQTKSVANTAADQTRMVVHDAKDQALRLAEEAKGQVRRQVDEQAGRLGRNLTDVGHQLRTMAEKSDDPESPVASITRQAADGVERLATRLEGGGLDQVLGDVQRFARNRPGVFLLGALGAGFVIGRLVKAVDLGEVAKGSNGSTGSPGGSVEPPLGGWDDRERTLPPAESSAGSYDGFATTSGSTGDEYRDAATSYPGTPQSPPVPSTPPSVSTSPGPQTTGYPSSAPAAPAQDEWGRT